MAMADELRCDAAVSTRDAGEPLAEGAPGGRCQRPAEFYLLNGRQRQGKACGECARRAQKDFKFITLEPIT